MSQFSDMQTRIFDECHYTNTTQVQRAIVSAVNYYNATRFWFNEAVTKFTASLTTRYAMATVLPTAIEIDSIKLYKNSIPCVLQRASWQELEEIDSEIGTGEPLKYAIHHDTLRIWPSPDATYSIEVSHMARISQTASGSSSTVWMNEAEALIRFRAKADVFLYMLDAENAQVCRAMETEHLYELRDRSTGKVATGRLKPWL